MKKLTLDFERIQVESFATTSAIRRGGTVLGHDTSNEDTFWSCNWSVDGGTFCEGPEPKTTTAPITCDTTNTMNPYVAECVTPSLAGGSCDPAQTCYPGQC